MGKLREQLAAAKIAREAFEARQTQPANNAVSDHQRSLSFLLIGLAAFYLVVRFGLTTKLDALGTYASYLFEISLVAFAYVLLRPRLSARALIRPLNLVYIAGSLAAGAAILKIARLGGIAVPMDVHDRETVFFLLAVAPVLEESLFRFLLWQPLERVWNSRVAWLATSVLFSYSHLHAIWFVPAEYDKFLIYQTIYTLPLALACGWMVRRQGSLLSAMMLHFAFNLGFFLAFWL